MATNQKSQENEVEGSIVHVIHVDDSGTDPVRTVLALATKDDISVTIDEDNEDFNAAAERRTRRYRTNGTADLEVASAIDVDMEAMKLAGLVDSNGDVTFDTTDRRIEAPDEYVEIAYFRDEAQDYANAELVHRFHDVEATSPEVDPSATPPLLSWTWWVESTIEFNADAL
ncbi:hypothetical protein [Halostella sp. PRR32]|uniref:hypothetical protein n=1 Tax=Halostella sp. PRR32 TaxID=3098147 RepID=UPI002B1DAD9C|nr:hypothetical protein [Halostella sp. PRR32]